MNLAAIVLSSQLNSTSFTVTRDPGSSVTGGGYFGRGGFIPASTSASASDTLTATGVICPTDPRMLDLLEEGDRISSVISVYTTTQLRVSTEGPPASEADLIVWQGLLFKVVKVFPWSAYGYCEALATQITTA